MFGTSNRFGVEIIILYSVEKNPFVPLSMVSTSGHTLSEMYNLPWLQAYKSMAYREETSSDMVLVLNASSFHYIINVDKEICE